MKKFLIKDGLLIFYIVFAILNIFSAYHGYLDGDLMMLAIGCFCAGLMVDAIGYRVIVQPSQNKHIKILKQQIKFSQNLTSMLMRDTSKEEIIKFLDDEVNKVKDL